jgi:hypothetical protein
MKSVVILESFEEFSVGSCYQTLFLQTCDNWNEILIPAIAHDDNGQEIG